METKDGRDCIHLDTNIWLSALVREEKTWENASTYLSHTVYSRQTRAGMSIIVLGEIVCKLIEFFRKDVPTLMETLDFIDTFIIRGGIVIHNLDNSDMEIAQRIIEDTDIRAHISELLEISVALRTGAKVFETTDEIADSDVLKSYLKEKGLALKKFNPE